MKFLTSGKYLVSLARRAASTRSVLENRKYTLTLYLRKSQTLLIEVESRQDLRTGSGFARTNLALVVCTRSRGDALGGETDMSNQNPRYGFGNPKCVSHSFLLQSLPSSTTSDTSGVQRPTDCLWSGWRRWERGLNCPEHDPRTHRPMEPRSSSADLRAPILAGQRKKALIQGQVLPFNDER